ncbi:MAG: AAA family ATPase [Oscillospiraceae bacterium]|nr:AAA family ATPase [Oscillospiraceae bacterium]
MKERMMVSVLEQFIKEDEDYRVGVLIGLRKTGKTTILEQLSKKIGFAKLIDFREETAWAQYIEFLKSDNSLLLIDEITHINDYEDAVRAIEHDVHNSGKKFKVIFSGSAFSHVKALQSSILGGGRSRLFKLPVLSFVEYLNFTGKITHNNYNAGNIMQNYIHNPQDFFDYLDLKGLEDIGASGLKFTLDYEYLRQMYEEIEISNDNCKLVSSGIKITESDVKAIGSMIAYTLSEFVKYKSFTEKKGEREIKRIARAGEFNPAMLKNAEINQSVAAYRNILPAERRAMVLYFLLKCNLAYVEFQHETRDKCSLQQLLADIDAVSKKQDFADIVDNYNICLINPILYTRLGKDILKEHKLDNINLYESFIKGHLIENYIKGSYCMTTADKFYTIYKLGGSALPDEPPEVDMLDYDRGILTELKSYDNSKNSLKNYFREEALIRILTTNGEEDTPEENRLGYYRIPFTKLCILTDTGFITSLKPTKYNHLN